jgi:hydrogenase maturation factor
MYVVEVRDGLAIAVDEHRNRHTVATDLVEPVALGDELLVHAGVAIAQLATAQLATAQLATAQLATAGAAPEGPRQ